MKKALQISIVTPCHENWDAMDQVEKGKFCGSCQKQVIDFTHMSDHDIAQFFKKPSTGSVCGRFMNEQLEREIPVTRKRIPWLKYFFQIAIPALLFSKVSSGQTGKPPKMERSVNNDTMRVQAGHELRTLGMVLASTIEPEQKKAESVGPVTSTPKVPLKQEEVKKNNGSNVKKSAQPGEGLTGKTGGLTVVRNWEPRLFYRK